MDLLPQSKKIQLTFSQKFTKSKIFFFLKDTLLFLRQKKTTHTHSLTLVLYNEVWTPFRIVMPIGFGYRPDSR
jgi:hypothetical protein